MMTKEPAAQFELIKYRLKYQLICIDSDRIDQCMRHYVDARLDGIYLSARRGYRLSDLAFLRDYPFITRVAIGYAPTIRVSELAHLKSLQSLNLADNKQPIDFSAFPQLKHLAIDWHRKMAFPERWKVGDFRLSNYKPKSKDFTELPDAPSLGELEVVRSTVQSLAGLGRFKTLKTLKLYYLSKLRSIAELDARSVDFLDFDVCRNITDHAYVATLPNVEYLGLRNCGTIRSLNFLNDMPTLKRFGFTDTDVADGDMTPCFRLERAGFTSKKHFSHTQSEVNEIIEERQKKAGRKK